MVSFLGNVFSVLPVQVFDWLLTVLGTRISHQKGVEEVIVTCAG